MKYSPGLAAHEITIQIVSSTIKMYEPYLECKSRFILWLVIYSKFTAETSIGKSFGYFSDNSISSEVSGMTINIQGP